MFKPMTGIQVDKFYPPADWKDNNNNWIDIRKGAEDNTITVLYGVKSGAYSLFGFVVNVSSGTYDVYIDDVKVGDSITANTQYDIDFDNITTSYGTATTPETLTLHKVVIKPTTSGATITKFRCERTSGATNYQYQGMMWCHLELENSITISTLCNSGNYYVNTIFYALTSKGDTITSSDLTNTFRRCVKLQYIPTIKSSSSMTLYGTFTGCDNCTIKRAIFLFETANSNNILFLQCNNMERLVTNNPIRPTNAFISARKLKMLPNFATTDWVVANTMDLYPTKLDLSDMTSLKQVLINGTSTYTARGIKGLKVSNSAPFGGNSPQINISYTGLDRNALVELFNSLPTVTGSQTLNCAGATGNNITIVGTPTIANGVVSGFGSGNYVYSSVSFSSNDFEVVTSFKINSFINGEGILSTNYVQGKPYFNLRVNNQNGLTFIIKETSSLIYSIDTTTLQLNKQYWIKIIRKNNIFYLYLSEDGINYVLQGQKETIILFETNQLRFGYEATQTGQYFTGGEIDLPQTYIKVKDDYIMKEILTEADKQIATDKGWALTLS